MKHKIVIIGGGIAGMATAAGLLKNGIECVVFEAASSFQTVGAGIGLSFNAVRACQQLGMADELKQKGKIIYEAWITDEKGSLLTKIDYSKYLDFFKEASVLIKRYELHETLLQKVGTERIIPGKKVKSFYQHNDGVSLIFEDGDQCEASVVIAADGIHSIFRKFIIPQAVPRFAGYTCWRGLGKLPDSYPHKEVFIESWGCGSRWGIVPLKNDDVYWYAVTRSKERDITMKTADKEFILHIFNNWKSEFLEVFKNIPASKLIHNDIYDIEPLDRFAYGNILLIGDAAHATTPDLGQGGSQALEDAVVLSNLLKQHHNYQHAFREFEKIRIPRTTKVIHTSRNMARIGQLSFRPLIPLRNFLMKHTPEKYSINQLKWLTKTPF